MFSEIPYTFIFQSFIALCNNFLLMRFAFAFLRCEQIYLFTYLLRTATLRNTECIKNEITSFIIQCFCKFIRLKLSMDLTIPSSKFVCVDYPGIVANVDKMLQTLGEEKNIAKVWCCIC